MDVVWDRLFDPNSIVVDSILNVFPALITKITSVVVEDHYI